MTSITIVRPVTVAEPRGAVWAAQAAWGFLQFFSRLMAGQRMLRQAASRAAEAAAARRLAASMRHHDPRGASDLLAAVDRQEAR